MQHYYAQLNDDGVVVSVSQLSGIVDAPDMVALQTYDTTLMGKRYDADAGIFEDVAPPPPAPNPTEWLIDVGPFFDRFGAAKMAVLTSTDAGVKAILADTQVRKWIDLQRADVAQSVAYIGTVVSAVTPALQTAILTTPVTPEENLALRKQFFS